MHPNQISDDGYAMIHRLGKLRKILLLRDDHVIFLRTRVKTVFLQVSSTIAILVAISEVSSNPCPVGFWTVYLLRTSKRKIYADLFSV